MPRMISHGGLLIIAAIALLLLGCLKLNPQTATNPVGTEHTVTASVCLVQGNPVNFEVTGANPMGPTPIIAVDIGGGVIEATFTYTGTNVGTDTITATAKGTNVCALDDTDTATKEWTEVVGGIAELPEVDGTPLETAGSSGPSTTVLAGIVIAVAAGTIALGGAAWYARRRLR